MTYQLPDIEPIEEVKVGKTLKKVLSDHNKAIIRQYVYKVTQQQLAEHFHVSIATMKRWIKSLHLANNKNVDGKRKEVQHKERLVKNQVKQIIKQEEQQHDPTLFIATMPTGKDLNGVSLTNEDRTAIDLVKQTGESPNANVEFYARTEDRKLKQRRDEQIKQREQDNKADRFNRRVAYFYEQTKKDYKEMGQYFPVLRGLMKNLAICRARNEEAQQELNRVGNTEEVMTAKGHYGGKRKTAEYTIAQETSRAEQVAYRQLDTEVDKILRRAGGEDEELPGDKATAEIMKMLKEED